MEAVFSARITQDYIALTRKYLSDRHQDQRQSRLGSDLLEKWCVRVSENDCT